MGFDESSRPKKVDFLGAVQLFFANFANFKGRASKSEYWWSVLFCFLVTFVIGLVSAELSSIASLILFIPQLSVAIRRLHDTGKSWVYYLFGLIPLAGFIILIIFFCKDSEGDNQWGLGPIETL